MTMMPIHYGDVTAKSVITFIKHIKQRKRLYESQRLLYVAITRAKQTLTLMLPTQNTKGTWADAI